MKVPVTPAMIDWLANGERGISSDTIFQILTGIPTNGGISKYHPSDADDFKRCRLLLEKCTTLKIALSEMGQVSPEWDGLVNKWEEISLLMDEETPDWRNSRGIPMKTNRLLREVLAAAKVQGKSTSKTEEPMK